MTYEIPEWVVLCGSDSPLLVELRNELEQKYTGYWAWWRSRQRNLIYHLESGGQIQRAIAVLSKALQTGAPNVRWNACYWFLRIGDSSAAILQALRATLDDESIQVRAAAAKALLALGELPDTIVTRMAESLDEIEPPPADEKAEDDWLPGRYYAAQVLSDLRQAARPARDALLRHLSDEDGSVRAQVAQALTNMGEPLATVLPSLIQALHGHGVSERSQYPIFRLLMHKYRLPARDFLPMAVDAMGGSDERRQRGAWLIVEALARDENTAPGEWLPVVRRVLTQSSDPRQVLRALHVLEQAERSLKAESETIDAVIQRALATPELRHATIVAESAQLLVRAGVRVTSARSAIRSWLELASISGLIAVRQKLDMLLAMVHCDAPGKSLLQELSSLLEDDSPLVQVGAASLLAENHRLLDQSVAVLVRYLDDPDDRLRHFVVLMLLRIGPAAAAAIPALLRHLREDAAGRVRLAARCALCRIAPEHPEVRMLLAGEFAGSKRAVQLTDIPVAAEHAPDRIEDKLTAVVTEYLAGNAIMTGQRQHYGIAVTAVSDDLRTIDLTFTFKGGRSYCCYEPGCHFQPGWMRFREIADVHGVWPAFPLTIRLHAVVEAGSIVVGPGDRHDVRDAALEYDCQYEEQESDCRLTSIAGKMLTYLCEKMDPKPNPQG